MYLYVYFLTCCSQMFMVSIESKWLNFGVPFFVPLACRGQDQLFLNGVVEVGLLTNVWYESQAVYI